MLDMRDTAAIWIVAGAAAISTTANSVLDVLLAVNVADIHVLAPVKALLFTAFALQVVGLGCIIYYCLSAVPQSRKRRSQVVWLDPGLGAGFNAVTLAVNGVALIWLTTRQRDLSQNVAGIRTGAFVMWSLAIVSQGLLFVMLSRWIRKTLEMAMPAEHVTTFGITLPPSKDVAYGTRPSFCSRGTTLASRPETPASSRTFSMRSSITKVGSSLRSKFGRNSSRSSLNLPAFPAAEATALGNAFDRYDSSQVDLETRSTILLSSSPTFMRSTHCLEPIPGSRPGSPEDVSTMLPRSPALRQQAQSRPSSKARSNPFDSAPSSPILGPTNFSRPTSRGQQGTNSLNQLKQPRISASMTDLIHPLFRPDSPSPPQILTSGTMVTASPMADQLITPKSLARLRSASDLMTRQDTITSQVTLSPAGEWQVMPPIETVVPSSRPRSKSYSAVASRRPDTAESDSAESSKLIKTDTMGSPGPSIIEEDELPPILPSFVLSAGSRSSLVGYGKRKSVKRDSAHLV